jgi:ubiquinone/menaquinone biosynthesis C-methylase UbiE
VYSVDIQEKMTKVALRNIVEAGLSSRVRAVTADVCKMPFDDDSVDLVVSRGSLPFWEDRSAAFREIYRVLKPGGSAYVGGGFGSTRIKSRVMKAFSTNEALKANREKFLSHMKRPKFTPEQLLESLVDASVVGTVKREYCGLWVQIIKPGRQVLQALNATASRTRLLREAENQS